MLEDQSYRPFPDFRGISRSLVYCSILSRNGDSGKAGAVRLEPTYAIVYFDTLRVNSCLERQRTCAAPLSVTGQQWLDSASFEA